MNPMLGFLPSGVEWTVPLLELVFIFGIVIFFVRRSLENSRNIQEGVRLGQQTNLLLKESNALLREIADKLAK